MFVFFSLERLENMCATSMFRLKEKVLLVYRKLHYYFLCNCSGEETLITCISTTTAALVEIESRCCVLTLKIIWLMIVSIFFGRTIMPCEKSCKLKMFTLRRVRTTHELCFVTNVYSRKNLERFESFIRVIIIKIARSAKRRNHMNNWCGPNRRCRMACNTHQKNWSGQNQLSFGKRNRRRRQRCITQHEQNCFSPNVTAIDEWCCGF